MRARDPGDRRRHLVELTAAGRRAWRGAWQAAEQAEEDLLSPLLPAEREQLHEHLERLVGSRLREALLSDPAEPEPSTARRLLALFRPYRRAPRRRSSS